MSVSRGAALHCLLCDQPVPAGPVLGPRRAARGPSHQRLAAAVLGAGRARRAGGARAAGVGHARRVPPVPQEGHHRGEAAGAAVSPAGEAVWGDARRDGTGQGRDRMAAETGGSWCGQCCQQSCRVIEQIFYMNLG